jgi:predicted O-linked N-acetylglucosamine transferase (SPINDLY family)
MMPAPHTFSLPPDLQQALHRALEYRKGGRPAEAAALYRQYLTRYPQHPALLGALGELLLQQGDFQAALPLLEQAKQAAPGHAPHWLMLTQCLLQLERAKDAKKIISEAIGKGLRHPLADELLRQARSGHKQKSGKPVPLNESLRQLEALFQAGRYGEMEMLGRELQHHHAKAPRLEYLLGSAALIQGRLRDALPPLRRAVQLDPRLAEAQFNLGFALEGLGRLDEALDAYRRTVAVAPQLAEAHNNLGNVLQKLKRHDEAVSAYQKALALRPEVAQYHMNRGDALRDLQRLEDADAAYRTAIRLKPDLVEVNLNLAHVLQLQGRYEASVEHFQRAIDLRPDYVEAYQGMGHALRSLGRHEEAEAAYRRALELKPDDASIYINLGKVLKEASRYEAALDSFQRALALKPDSDSAFNQLAGTLLDMGRHEEALKAYRRGLALDPGGLFYMHSNMLMMLTYQAGGTPQQIQAEARAFGEKAARKAVPFMHHDNVPNPGRRLRIGLVSGDLGNHPVGFFLQNVLESLDPDKLEVFAYETSERKDTLNQRLRRSVHQWRDASVARMSDEVLANQIRADGIDVLIDLAGHTGKNRLPVFAWKPAPVQVTWLGYFATTGLNAVDYVLADPRVLPAREEGQFVEKPWRLPDVYYCFSPPEVALGVAPLPAGQTGLVTFGCFNNPSKLNDGVIACWAKVLNAVADSQLFLKYKGYKDATLVKGVRDRFARFGIAGERLRFEGNSPRDEYLAAYHHVDIALDPFPYPGGTTSVEGLWMGVPVLTLAGQRFISHQGETILHNVGLPEWIAVDEDDYVARAAAYARDTQALAALRAGLRDRLLASPLCDAPRFARNFEDAMRGMWQKWCGEQQPPEVSS